MKDFTFSDTMTFLGGTSTVAALPSEAFAIEPGTIATINRFAVATNANNGDKLDLTELLNGLSGTALTQSALFGPGGAVGYTESGSGSNWTTGLAINGPGGTATLTLGSSSTITQSQLYNQVFYLPPH
jgi:hypothetical protein